ncbi:MAG: GH77 [uncultured Propionibacteriaceae bacterium]|uniref:4-alpha-glucanotransferase n=1 Tax=uncultured Propionibacteriaceae bacterium TaxID=257457 RepID=A0A6J4NCG4_9ACTN|nr:MAG: GH77 [uncultured Propionibacteriaceae bacterium]
MELDPTLRQLADAHAIATEYWDWQGNHVVVGRHTIVDVLAALGVDAATPDAAEGALAQQQRQPWTRMLPTFLATRDGRTASVWVHVPHGAQVRVWIDLEDGDTREHLHQMENWTPPRDIDGQLVGEASFEIPANLPTGYHTLRAHSGDREDSMPLVVTPSWLGIPAQMGSRRGWGLATQLYSVRSERSWGIGDLTDLTDLAVWSAAEHDADFVLINPLHAAEPVPPMEPSPYLPTTRRFVNPIYLRIERIPEYAEAKEGPRAEIRAIHKKLRKAGRTRKRINRDAVWAAKLQALSIVFKLERSAGRELAFRAFCNRQGPGLDDYATWSVLAQTHGSDWTAWPEPLQHPAGEAVADFRAEHSQQVDFHRWLQWLLDEQLRDTQAAAVDAGMALGVMQDLAVGVHPSGADSWGLQDIYASGITVGAPPDPYNQNGQDWTQPPWRPDKLAETGYAPYRALVSSILRHAGGIRVDHIIGLFRLWWIPAGAGPTAGTYVRYDHEALIGILALEAQRAGALVVGEDLGTVEPWVREYLKARGILGTSILWFEFDHDGGGDPLPPDRWREYCLASVTTHDLPPTAGYLAGDHVRLRDDLGVLTRPVEEELAADEVDRQAWLDSLSALGLLPAGADVEETVRALHAYLTRTPSRLLCVALTDAVGDRRIQNQPGTLDEYPNWRVPLTGPDGAPLVLEEVFDSSRAAALLAVVHGEGRD